MSIRQYYQQTAYINLNGSIVSAGLLSFILTASFLFSWNMPLVLVAVPFLLVCLLHYNKYLLYQNKSEESMYTFPRHNDKTLFSQNHLLLAFAPAPAVKLLFFTPDGMLAGELRELDVRSWRWFLPYFIDKSLKKSFGIYDAYGCLQASLLQDGKGIKMINRQKEVLGFFYYSKRNNNSQFATAIVRNGRKVTIEESSRMFPEMKLIDEHGLIVSRLQRGWMPLEWTSYFKDVHTPVLSFDYSLDQGGRLAFFAALAHRYMYHDH
ncbi:hypothetical protein M3204_07855 [Mesobacillus subterraneus]|uniref:hypothetical protein n=1 Tax=Mesobacillus subterraneus TaxID=285983 RepID=UPI00203C0F08|nr:hypothetical protein [Mesobacillus subterraneus]MCM3664313.1 hypothetical protein [Mesobacillus subterraneus]MCM3682340.1 hypothetical protein [Mesobacillus subterraneus]